MKKFVSLLIAILFVMALLLPTIISAPATVLAHTEGVKYTTPLITCQNITVGSVTVWNNSYNLFVQYDIAKEGWFLAETHLAVARSLNGIPHQTNGCPILDQFKYKHVNLGSVKSDLYTISRSSLNDEFGVECWLTKLYIAAQAKIIQVTKDCLSSVTEHCMSVVSDTTVSVTQGNIVGNAVEAWQPFDDMFPPYNTFWDQNLDYSFAGTGADWIWESYHTVHPVDGDIVHFEKTFDIPGTPTSGTLHITSDNGYEVYLNGTLVGSAQLGAGWEASNLTQTYVDTSNWQSVESYDLLSLLVPGSNTLLIKAANEYMGPLDGQEEGTIYTNPGGLIFNADICYELVDQEVAWGDGSNFPGCTNCAKYFTYTIQ